MKPSPENTFSQSRKKPQLTTDKTIRLQKFLANCGVKSRRGCIDLLTARRVKVNGETVSEPGFRMDPKKDRVLVDEKQISLPSTTRTIVLYKPRGYICSTPTGRPEEKTVYELIKKIKERLVTVGRLDKNSEGLLLMSNNGILVLRLTHPRYGSEKTYHATVSGEVNRQVLQQLSSRMTIDGYRIMPAKVRLLRESENKGKRYVLSFTLKEGRNRQIRKMCEMVGLKIHRLVRISVGKLSLKGMKPGQWRDLTPEELKELAS